MSFHETEEISPLHEVKNSNKSLNGSFISNGSYNSNEIINVVVSNEVRKFESLDIGPEIRISEDIIINFLSRCKIQNEKICNLIEKTNIEDYDSLFDALENESEKFIDSLKDIEECLELYGKNEVRFREDFYGLAKLNRTSLDYYELAQIEKEKGFLKKMPQEFMPFISGRNLLKSLLKRCYYRKFVEAFDFNSCSEDSSFNNFMTFFKFYYNKENKPKIKEQGIEYFNAIINSFETKSIIDNKNIEDIKKDYFYSILKVLVESSHYNEDQDDSGSEDDNINKMIVRKLKMELLNLESKKAFKGFKYLALDTPKKEYEIMIYAKKNIEIWDLNKEPEFLNYLVIQKLLKKFLKIENFTMVLAKNDASDLKDSIDIFLDNMIRFDEEFRKDYLLEETKSWKTKIENNRFNKDEIIGFVKKMEKLMTFSTLLAIKRKNKNLAFGFIFDVIKVLCNFNKEDATLIYVKNFPRYLSEFSDIVCDIMNGSMKPYEYNNCNRLPGYLPSLYSTFSDRVRCILDKWMKWLTE